jgi:hypothetical protein
MTEDSELEETTGFLGKINELKESYYSTNTKNSFFKKSQKMDCAKYISDSIDLNTLIDNTVYAIPEKNIVFINYPVFKYYANPENYSQIIEHIITVFKYVIEYYGSYEVYINLSSFTVSAAERYKEVIKIFCDTCLNDGTNFSELLVKFHILNTPTVMEMIVKILKPLADPVVMQKIQFYKKEESADLVATMAR